MADHQKILILDFGGQYTQLIARRVRENHVYSEVVPWSISASEIAARQPVGIILSGGPASVCDPDAPHCDPAIYDLGVPVLGICYGMQLTARLLGGRVKKAKEREYGRITARMQGTSGLLDGLSLYDAARRGAAIGALQIQVAGDNEGLPTRSQLQEFQERAK